MNELVIYKNELAKITEKKISDRDLELYYYIDYLKKDSKTGNPTHRFIINDNDPNLKLFGRFALGGTVRYGINSFKGIDKIVDAVVEQKYLLHTDLFYIIKAVGSRNKFHVIDDNHCLLPCTDTSVAEQPSISKYKELLISFLRTKNTIVRIFAGIDYINEEDIEDVHRWLSEKFCRNFLLHCNTTSDAYFCPWCHIYMSLIGSEKYKKTTACPYGKRHGFCAPDCRENLLNRYNSEETLYYKILSKGSEINNMPGIKDLVKEYKNLAKKL